jgi:GH15 family glucan-1,4-alpha-glucosidase
VRIGNDASQQLQLDIYGEVFDAMYQARIAGIPPPERARALRPVVLEYLLQAWRQPDEGLWEVRGGPQHFVHSKVMAWVAFDRAANGGRLPIKSMLKSASEVSTVTLTASFKPTVPRGLTLACCYSRLWVFSPRAIPACGQPSRAVEERLLIEGEFVLRYETENPGDGLPEGEGAFLACSFWLVDNYILQGRHAEARKLFDRLLSRCNDVGLLAEEIDPLTGRMLGNFPQAYSHVGLINCALNLSRQMGPAEERAASEESS